MDIEKKIRKKEERKAKQKKMMVPIILVILIIAIVLGIVYIAINLCQKNQKDKNDNTNIEEEYIEDVGYGKLNSKGIVYNGVRYYYEYDENFKRKIMQQKIGDQEKVEIMSFKENITNIWLGEGKFFVSGYDFGLKTYNLDGTGVKEILPKSYINATNIHIDFKRKTIYYTYSDYEVHSEYIEKCDLDGNNKNKITEGYYNICDTDEDNVYYSLIERYENDEDNAEISLYILDKDKNEMKKIITETALGKGSSYVGFDQVLKFGNYIYYVFGMEQGTVHVFYGSIYRIKEDGTGKEDILGRVNDSEFFMLGNRPKMLVQDNYLYFEGKRVNKENDLIVPDNYKQGDVMDKDYIYTVATSDNNIKLVKYKLGTDFEDLQTIFSKEKDSVESVGSYDTSLDMDKQYVYITINYYDYNTNNWRPMNTNTEVFKVKKDGSSFEMIEEEN